MKKEQLRPNASQSDCAAIYTRHRALQGHGASGDEEEWPGQFSLQSALFRC